MACLSTKHRQLLSEHGTRRHCERGELLFAQGSTPHSLFLIEEGLLKIECSSGAGRDVITELLFPGDVCGVLCGLDSQPYPVSAVCLSPCTVVEIPKDEFSLLTHEDEAMFGACSDICRVKMRFQRDMTVAMAVERVEQRAARVLVMLAQRLGRTVNGQVELDFPLSRQDFSELIGTALETAIRALSSLRKAGLIQEPGEHHLVITNWPALQRLAEGS